MAVVRTGPVESLVVNTVTSRILAYVGDQPSIEPAIQAAVRQAVSNRAITEEIRAAAESLQAQLVSGHANTLTLTLPHVGSAVAASIQPVSPQIAAAVSRLGTITVLDVSIPPSAAQAIDDLGRAGADFPVLVLGTIVLVVLALVLSADRGRTLIALGLAAFASGALAVAIYLAARGLVVDEFSSLDARTAAQTAWSVYLGGLETSGFVLAAVGAAVAVAGAFV